MWARVAVILDLLNATSTKLESHFLDMDQTFIRIKVLTLELTMYLKLCEINGSLSRLELFCLAKFGSKTLKLQGLSTFATQ